MRQEYKISEGRYLVSANLGEGFEEYSTPQEAFEFLKAQRDEAMIVHNPLALRERPESLFRARLDRMTLRELAETMLTIQLEWFFLIGNYEVIKRL